MEEERVYTKAESIAALVYKTAKGAATLEDRFDLQKRWLRADSPTCAEARKLAQQMLERDVRPVLCAGTVRFAA